MSKDDFVQAENNDESEEIEFGEKLKQLLNNQEEKDVLAEIDESAFVKVELPNGMTIAVPRDSDKAQPGYMANLLKDVPEDDFTDFDPDVEDKTHTHFVTKEGHRVDIGGGPAKSDYKPGQLRKFSLEDIKRGQDKKKAEQLKRRYIDATFLPFHLALAVPFVVLWRKITSLWTKSN